jgi:hypothetical protein
MNKNKLIQLLKKTISSTAFRAMCLCVFFSLVLWMFIVFSDHRQHDFEIPIQFENSAKPDEFYYTRDSVVVVNVEATGFEFLFKSGYEDKKEKIYFDVSKLPINKSKGEMKISSDFLKTPITKSLGMENVSISILPDTILLKWQKKYSKKMIVVNQTKFETKNSYRIIKNPELLINKVVVEGDKRVLDKIDTVFTKKINISNIDKSHVALIPLEINQQHKGLYFRTTNIPVKISVEEITENEIELPINIVQQGEKENVKIFPSKVKVKYRVPIKDFTKINAENFNLYVLYSEDNLQNANKLKIRYANIPNNVEVIGISPRTVDYIIINE